MIVTVRGATGMGIEDAVGRVLRSRNKTLPTRLAKRGTIAAYVNHGRWVADCPFCRGSELVDPTDPRFFCLSCLNAGVRGQWIGVQFPQQRKAIESALLERPIIETRNWIRGETVTDLRIEAKRMGN